MEDEKIKSLFSNFQPALSSSADFMNRLQKNMEMAEILRQYTITLRRRNHMAVVIAAACGCVFGMLAMLLLNPLAGMLSGLTFTLPFLQASAISFDTGFFTWIAVATVTILSALCAYDLAMTRLSPKIKLRD